MYQKTQHNIVEFWHKNMYLQEITAENIYLRFNYISYSSSSKKIPYLDGGQIKIYQKKNEKNNKICRDIKENYKIGKEYLSIDIILRNLDKKILGHLHLKSTGLFNKSAKNEEYQDQFNIFGFYFLFAVG
jgi:hypothetical protein